jgi:hypothetical protein
MFLRRVRASIAERVPTEMATDRDRQLEEILHHWSTVVDGYAREVQFSQEICLTWEPCRLLVNAAREFWLDEGRTVHRWLDKSRSVLRFEER